MNGRFYVVEGAGQGFDTLYRTTKVVTTRNKANRLKREFDQLYDFAWVEAFDTYQEAQSAVDRFMLGE